MILPRNYENLVSRIFFVDLLFNNNKIKCTSCSYLNYMEKKYKTIALMWTVQKIRKFSHPCFPNIVLFFYALLWNLHYDFTPCYENLLQYSTYKISCIKFYVIIINTWTIFIILRKLLCCRSDFFFLWNSFSSYVFFFHFLGKIISLNLYIEGIMIFNIIQDIN